MVVKLQLGSYLNFFRYLQICEYVRAGLVMDLWTAGGKEDE